MAKDRHSLPSLEALQRKIDHAKSDGHEEEENAAESARSIGKAMRLGTELLAGVGVGGVIGYWIDHFAETSPIFFILFFFLGFAAGVRNLLRSENKVE